MEIELPSIIALIALSQGIFFAALLLLSKKYKSRTNTFLALLILDLIITVLRIHGFIQNELFIQLFEHVAVEYLLPVFLLLYVLKSVDHTVDRWVYILLLCPFLAFSSIHSLLSLADIYEWEALGATLEDVEIIELYVIVVFILVVSIKSVQIVQKSPVRPAFKKWLFVIFWSMISLSLLLLGAELFESLLTVDIWEYAWTGTALFLIAVSFYGVQQATIEQQVVILRSFQNVKKANETTSRKGRPTHFEQLQRLMTEDKLFKLPDLSREMVASRLGLAPSTVSRILKENSNQSLTDFVNAHRVELAKSMLDDRQFDIFSLEAIGREVGFKSRSAFYEAFKKMTGKTPGNYKKQR